MVVQFEDNILVSLKKTNTFDQKHWETKGKQIFCDKLNTTYWKP